jgi:hypothetical protein
MQTTAAVNVKEREREEKREKRLYFDMDLDRRRPDLGAGRLACAG